MVHCAGQSLGMCRRALERQSIGKGGTSVLGRAGGKHEPSIRSQAGRGIPGDVSLQCWSLRQRCGVVRCQLAHICPVLEPAPLLHNRAARARGGRHGAGFGWGPNWLPVPPKQMCAFKWPWAVRQQQRRAPSSHTACIPTISTCQHAPECLVPSDSMPRGVHGSSAPAAASTSSTPAR